MKTAVFGKWLEPVELAQVGNPTVANGLPDGAGQFGIRSQQPASRCHSVRFVAKTFGKHFGEILNCGRAQEFRVDGGHSIRDVRAKDRKVGHADLALLALFDKAHALDSPLIARKASTNFIEKPPVNLVDDFQMPG